MSKTHKKTIQVFLATYNRPELVQNAIESVLRQSFDSFELIVSDNSTNNVTERIIKEKYIGKLRYTHRIPTSNNHFNLILDEVESDYFMIFHDDDVMLPGMLEWQHEAIKNNNELIAVGANAFLNINGKLTRKKVFRNSGADLLLHSVDEVVKQYMLDFGTVPFPSYLYRRKIAEQLRFDALCGGKHSDVSFIMNVAQVGRILLLNIPLMNYSIHKGQDSQSHAFVDRLKLVNYITRNSGFTRRHELIIRYRVFNLYSELKSSLPQEKMKLFSRRSFKVIGLILLRLPMEYWFKTLMIVIYSIYKRVLV